MLSVLTCYKVHNIDYWIRDLYSFLKDMNHSTEITAGVIIIGNEVLSGRTQDTNLAYMGKQLDALGIRIMESRVIPDIEQIIIDTVNHFRATYAYVFTTGGIGPTHDDITSAAIAKTFQVKLEKNAEAVSLLEKYYEPGVSTKPG